MSQLKLRLIGLSDYAVIEGRQRIGRIRLATERMPGVWLWNVYRPPDRRTPDGIIQDFDTAKAAFEAAWEVLKAVTPPEQLAAATRP